MHVGVGPWLPLGVGCPGGRRRRRFTGSGLQRTSCWGKQGDRCGFCVAGRCRAGCMMRVGGGVLALLFSVTSDTWAVVSCASWPGCPGARFRSWGCGGWLSSVPRSARLPPGVCVAFGVSSGMCALCVLARPCRVWLVVLRGLGGLGMARIGLRVVVRCAFPLWWLPPGCGASRGLVWCF